MFRRALAKKLLSATAASAVGLCLLAAACRKSTPPPRAPQPPSVRLYFLSTVAGALEPCGCRKDMLGGIDHAAALLRTARKEAPNRLLLASGPLFFLNPTLEEHAREQEVWKAGSLAESLQELELGAWAPGLNDFAAGPETFATLRTATGARALGWSNDPEGAADPGAVASFLVGSHRVGVVGVAATPGATNTPESVHLGLTGALAKFEEEKARIRVALLSMPRGEALRLAEQLPGFNVMALGKPSDEGDANDAPFPPVLVGDTLVIQAPNHLQALAYVDFRVVGDELRFADATGIERAERVAALSARVAALSERLERWQAQSQPSPDDVAMRRRELTKLTARLEAEKGRSHAAPTGNSFDYRLVEVRESAGADSAVAGRLASYYRRVNAHNQKAFANRMPAAAPPGTPSYAGGASCATCHAEAHEFWRGTGHAGAYETLSSQYKQFNLDCVSCHVTGYNRPGGSTVTHVERLRDVQCESCHGPGSRHVESGGEVDFITLTPSESVCQGCHHPPHVADDWDAKLAWPNIVGPGHGAAQ